MHPQDRNAKVEGGTGLVANFIKNSGGQVHKLKKSAPAKAVEQPLEKASEDDSYG